MPANILDPGNERIRDIINLPDSRLQLINFGIIDDGATSLNFQFQGADILTIESDGDFTFAKDISLAGSLTFLNAGAGGNPVLSSNSNDTTLTLAGNLEMPGTNAIIFPDSNWEIKDISPSGNILVFNKTDGQSGTIEFQNNAFDFSIQLTSDVGFRIREKTGVPTLPAFQINTQILVASDVNEVPIMVLKADRVGTAIINNRPLFQIQNLNTPAWLLDNDGTVTQFGDLVMGDNAISFQDWQVQHVTLGDNVLEFKIINEGNGQFNFTTKEISVQTFLVDGNFLCEVLQNNDTTIDETKIPFNTSLLINSLNDDGSAPLMVFNASPFINNRSLFEIQNQNNTRWNLDNDGTVTQSGNLVMDDKEIQFREAGTKIVESVSGTAVDNQNLEIHVLGGKQLEFFNGGTSPKYEFGANNANWKTQGIAQMGAISFVNPGSSTTSPVSIQRSNNNLELDANIGGEIVLRILDGESTDVEEYNFASTIATFNFNNLTKVGVLDCRSFKIIGLKDVITPNIATFFDQTIPTAETEIFGWEFFGVSADGTDGIPYAEIFVNQEVITDLLPEGSINFDIANGTAIGPVPFIKFDGETSKLALQDGIDLSFQNVANDGTLRLETNSDDLLTFQDQIILTQTLRQNKEQQADLSIEVGTTVTLPDLTVAVSARPGGTELFIYEIQVKDGSVGDEVAFFLNVFGSDAPLQIFSFTTNTAGRIQMFNFFAIVKTDTGGDVIFKIDNNTGNSSQFNIVGGSGITTRVRTMKIS